MGMFNITLPAFFTGMVTLTDKDDDVNKMAVMAFPNLAGATLHKHYMLSNGASYGSKGFILKIEFDACLANFTPGTKEFDRCELDSVDLTPPNFDGTIEVFHEGRRIFNPSKKAEVLPKTGKTSVAIMKEAFTDVGQDEEIQKAEHKLDTEILEIREDRSRMKMMKIAAGVALIAGIVIYIKLRKKK